MDELFLPLLRGAAAQGVNPGLGLVQADRQQQQQQPPVRDGVRAAAGPSGGPTREQGGQRGQRGAAPPEVPRALLAEEVLMYHRAASRLVELCSRGR